MNINLAKEPRISAGNIIDGAIYRFYYRYTNYRVSHQASAVINIAIRKRLSLLTFSSFMTQVVVLWPFIPKIIKLTYVDITRRAFR